MTLINTVFPIAAPKVYKGSKLAIMEKAPEQIVGVEIEVEAVPQHSDWYTDHLSKLWMPKTDGSLRGNALEFVTQPILIGALLPELEKFYEVTGFKDTPNFTDRTSVHVHCNVTDMTFQQVSALCLVYSIVEELLFDFVNNYQTENKYRDTNLYSVPWNQCRMSMEVVTRLLRDPTSVRHWQKYTALNLLPIRTYGTVEWRHMHGTANMDKLRKWLNVIGAMMEFAKKNEFGAVVETVKKLNDTSAYRKFFTDVTQDFIPYQTTGDSKLAAGVVNAKCTMIGMNSKKAKQPLPVPAGADAGAFQVRWEFDEQEGPPAAPRAVMPGDPFGRVRPEGGRVAFPQRAPQWPLRRVLARYEGPHGPTERLVMDNNGRYFDRNGVQVVDVWQVVEFEQTHARGFGRDWTVNVTTDWRPRGATPTLAQVADELRRR